MFIFLLLMNDWFKLCFFRFLWEVFNLNFFVRILFFCIFLMIFFGIRVVELIFLIYEFLFLGDVLFLLFFLYFILVVLFFLGNFVFLRYFIDFFRIFVLFNDIWWVDCWSWLENDFFVFFFFIVFCNDVLMFCWLVLFFVFID